MLLRHRSAESEAFDSPDRPTAEVLKAYADLDRVNRLFLHAEPFTHAILSARHPERWRQVSVLEIGAGTGGLAVELEAWARQRGWQWDFTCLDRSVEALEFNPIARKIAGDAVALPFPDGRFDLVLASQMTHHLDDDAVIRHFREAWRVTRQSLIISDLHRNPFLLALVTLAGPVLGLSRSMRADGRASVRRGFRVPEWSYAAAAAGIPAPRITVRHGCRIVLWADRG